MILIDFDLMVDLLRTRGEVLRGKRKTLIDYNFVRLLRKLLRKEWDENDKALVDGFKVA